MDRPSVLVVDDDADFRVLVRAHLEEGGYAVWDAASGRDALALLHQVHPTLMLVDLAMPRMSGAELLRQVAGDREIEPLVVIAVSGRLDQSASPARWFLSKPLDAPLLLSVVRDFCGPGMPAVVASEREAAPPGDEHGVRVTRVTPGDDLWHRLFGRERQSA